MTNILFVDDDSDFLLSLLRAITAEGIDADLHVATHVKKAHSIQKEIHPEVIVLDLSLDEEGGEQSGFHALELFMREDFSCRIIVLTGHGSIENGVKAIQSGAANFLQKPPHVPHLTSLIRDGVEQSRLRRAFSERLISEEAGFVLAGTSEGIVRLRKEIEFAAVTDLPVFLRGETGCGKSFCASLLHRMSKASKGRFIRYQPTFGNSDLVNSDLFGHKKGSFTGATEDRRGLVQEADKGTLFLDEIDELPKETQVLLLSVLQDKRFRAVGSNTEIESNFRLLSASNAPLEKLIDEGNFRKDLYFRLSHITISIPSLRERVEDIPALARGMLTRLTERAGLSVFDLSPEALIVLRTYSWPGNIRELEAVVERAAYKAQFEHSHSIRPEDLMMEKANVATERNSSFHQQMASFKRNLIQNALDTACGNQSEAARLLQMDRTSLRRILKEIS